MNLVQKQQVFAQLVAELIKHAARLGYSVTLGEAHRPRWVAEKYAKEGIGSLNSLHISRLAIDLMLWKGGKWLTKSEDYKPLGDWWESMSTSEYKLIWGGQFDDGNHFSLEHMGIR